VEETAEGSASRINVSSCRCGGCNVPFCCICPVARTRWRSGKLPAPSTPNSLNLSLGWLR
jgi:hypothetical protein